MKKHGRDRHVFFKELLDLMASESLEDVENLDEERRALANCLDKLQHRPRQLVRSCYGGKSSIKEAALRIRTISYEIEPLVHSYLDNRHDGQVVDQ